jgi:hypothetical protein
MLNAARQRIVSILIVEAVSVRRKFYNLIKLGNSYSFGSSIAIDMSANNQYIVSL